MNVPLLHIIFGLSMIQSVSLTNVPLVIEVCDIEGSGIEDCPESTHCCKQSECDEFRRFHYVETKNSTDRCCNETETTEHSLRKDCRICTKCCNEIERNTAPLPNHCSKCRSCDNLFTVEKEIITG